MPQFTLPLPPTSNHGYATAVRYRAGRPYSRTFKTPELSAWEQIVALEVRYWEPPEQTPLQANIDLYLPKRLHRKADVDGFVKFILDSVVGKRSDHYVDKLRVNKYLTTDLAGWAEVIVEVI